MQDILRLGVHGGVLAVDSDMAVGCALGNASQLSTLVVAHQALAGLGSDEVGRLLAAVGRIAVCVQSGEVASGGTLHLVSLTGDVGLLGSGDVQAVILQGQNVASSSGNIDLDINLIASDGDGGGSILADGLSLVGIHQRSMLRKE